MRVTSEFPRVPGGSAPWWCCSVPLLSETTSPMVHCFCCFCRCLRSSSPCCRYRGDAQALATPWATLGENSQRSSHPGGVLNPLWKPFSSNFYLNINKSNSDRLAFRANANHENLPAVLSVEPLKLTGAKLVTQ